MANWTPMSLSIDTSLDEATAHQVAHHLIEDHPLCPIGCRGEDDVMERLVAGEELEWEDAGTATFSPAAVDLLRSCGLVFTYEVRDGFAGPGMRTTYYPATLEFVEEEFEGDFDDEDA